MMHYNIAFYCPDHHIEYDLRTINRTGVGGGITARTRIAQALAKRGHNIIMYVNCPREEIIQGIHFKHFSEMNNVNTDVFVVSTSAGNLDLTTLEDVSIHAKVKILMMHGGVLPLHTTSSDYDFFYVPSNFIRSILVGNGIDPKKIFVSYHGVAEENYKGDPLNGRDFYKLAYVGHPSKGLDAAISIFKILHQKDARFSLHIYGGNRLWGEEESAMPSMEGLFYHGLIGQKSLAHSLQKICFGLSLQSREEPFGMAVTESMRAGCIVIASPVGAYPELIKNGFNGFLLPGCHNDLETQEQAAELITHLLEHQDYMEYIRHNAVHSNFDWQTVAKSWEGHWYWNFSKPSNLNDISLKNINKCAICGGEILLLADGLHCTDCGNYQRSI
jgi:glycosyltransferase involved in cell wall biosynthesis